MGRWNREREGRASSALTAPTSPTPLTASSARSAAQAHLACRARTDVLPEHLRTCQGRERGCTWHPRHRGCGGPVLLALTRDRSGRMWRLADAARPARRRPATPSWCPTRCSAKAARRGLYLRRHAAPPCRARTFAGDTHLPRVCASVCHVCRCPTTGTGTGTGTGDALRMNACVAACLAAGLLRGMRLHRRAECGRNSSKAAGSNRRSRAQRSCRCDCSVPLSWTRVQAAQCADAPHIAHAARPSARAGGRCAG